MIYSKVKVEEQEGDITFTLAPHPPEVVGLPSCGFCRWLVSVSYSPWCCFLPPSVLNSSHIIYYYQVEVYRFTLTALHLLLKLLYVYKTPETRICDPNLALSSSST